MNKALDALHAVYHERDFRVRVNDTTIDMVVAALADIVNVEWKYGDKCPACKAGHDYMTAWKSRVGLE